MSSDHAIKIENLSKCYPIYGHPRDRLKQFILPRLQRMASQPPQQYFREFWALKDVSFEVGKGETVGIVGRNGSGKSTLLQMICGTLNHTTGSISTNGRIAALLELGSGFNPEFTGRENVYMNGALLGFSEDEIDRRFDRILEFSGIGHFIDQPVKTYSSGMSVRLAFAVQAQSDPDILIVDEALAVGDAKFQAKCFAHIKALKQRGTSILLVSHATEQIATHCDRAIFLNDGVMVTAGKPRDVINTYMDFMFGAERIHEAAELEKESPAALAADDDTLSLAEELFHTRQTYNPHEYRWGDRAARILDYAVVVAENSNPATVDIGDQVRLRLSIAFSQEVVRPILGFTIKTKEGVTLYNTNSELQACREISAAGASGEVMVATIAFKAAFAPGEYFVSIGVASRRPDGTVVPHDRRYDSIQLTVVARDRHDFSGFFDLQAKMTSGSPRSQGA
ncbi:ABC transporter ATP-binding protein [Pseudoduganella sp. R-34]|uniref:ABC transporter ATP-binding protein n=1 Tax=Pseudoduganella sp. R-34 TaxID=3404062 RepID=UPI003CF425A0